MSSQSLGSSIIKSLRMGEMDSEIPNALLTDDRTRIRHRTESKYWDYKEFVDFSDPIFVSELAKDVLAFHNTEGGVLVFGVADNFSIRGMSQHQILDTKMIHDKIRRYTANTINVFQNSIEVASGKFVWLIFIPKYSVSPVASSSNAPHRGNRPIFNRGSYFYRENDEVRLCRSDGDIERVFRGFSTEHLTAYNYEIDQPYFRLLNPNCERFVGRRYIVNDIKEKLNLRNPVVCLDGLGGVGKSAIAIQAVKELFESGGYMFIVSLSAKSKVWQGHVVSRQATFAGLHTMLVEIAKVLELPMSDDTSVLKQQIIEFMKDVNGLLVVDNLEEIDDAGVFRFLSEEVPTPSKILVTSRISKDLGARTISVPAMTASEAAELFGFELDRLGCPDSWRESTDFHSVLESAGGVPLAIKWAAQIASDCRSIRIAANNLRGATGSKQEFLSFCFATMYGSLSDQAKQVAMLIPFLDVEWKRVTVGVALELTVEQVSEAIFELADRGIVYRSSDHKTDEYGVLPLARDFLLNKWNDSPLLRQKVDTRLGRVFVSGKAGEFLLNWLPEKRIEFMISRARESLAEMNYQMSLTQVELAQSWINGDVQATTNTILNFLKGYAQFKLNRKSAVTRFMKQAMSQQHASSVFDGNEYMLASEALFSYGGHHDEAEASRLLSIAVDKGTQPNADLVKKYIGCNVRSGKIRDVASLVSRLRVGDLICTAFECLDDVLRDPTHAYSYEREWAVALGNLVDAEAEIDRKSIVLQKHLAIRERYLKAR